MTPRIFGSLHPFFEDGAINGRKLANAGFMTALLTLDPFDEYHFFVANPQALTAQWAARGHLPALQRKAAHALHRSELPRRLRETPYHVFHFSDPVTGFPAMCELRNTFAPEIFPVTAVNHSINYQEFAGPFLAHLWEGCGPRDAIGANSAAAMAALHGWFGHLRTAYALDAARCSGPRLRVLPMGVDEHALPRPGSQAAQARDHMRRTLGLGDESILLLLFGRIAVDDKLDPHPLLMALRRVRAAHPHLDAHLVISGFAGKENDPTELLRAVARLLAVPLHIRPNPDPDEKNALFAAADIFVSPSDNIQETFGLSLLEAASAELPVIASDWNGYRDIVVHGRTGLLIPTLAPPHTAELDAVAPALFENQHQFLRSQRTAVLVPALADAMALLAGDAPLRRRMGLAARARVLEHFTWTGVVRRWLEFWEELRAVPLPPETLARLRSARHPFRLPFGRVFAPYATACLVPATRLICTHAGHALREDRLPWEAAGKAPTGVSPQTVRQLLVLARNGATMAHLAARTGLADEPLHTHVLWALKHDLLEAVPNNF